MIDQLKVKSCPFMKLPLLICAICVCLLGCDAQNNQQGIKDDAISISKLEKKAQAENVQAMLELADMYERGQGVPQNYTEAFKWYQKAAERGNSTGQFRLGFFYYRGHGIGRDYRKAVEYFKLADGAGKPEAQVLLGDVYIHGLGIAKDEAQMNRF